MPLKEKKTNTSVCLISCGCCSKIDRSNSVYGLICHHFFFTVFRHFFYLPTDGFVLSNELTCTAINFIMFFTSALVYLKKKQQETMPNCSLEHLSLILFNNRLCSIELFCVGRIQDETACVRVK